MVSSPTRVGIGVLFFLALTSVRAEDASEGEESRGVILNALTLGAGAVSLNVSIDGCVWRKGQVVASANSEGSEGDTCPDPAVKFYLYTSLGSPRREIDTRNSASALASAGWVQHHHTVLLIHGYGGGDNTIPISILRDAYLSRGDFNVIVVDWGGLAPLPCYPAAVHNSAHVGRCAAVIPRMLRDAGAATDSWTCVGHSLGAHVCGSMSEYLSFRVHKIIGLDPARPLVRPSLRFRLDPSDAAVVHVIHTDAGHYGESGRLGTADFCVNGGRTQPQCRFSTKGEHLCNHVSAVCFFAESLDPGASLTAEPCSRRCVAVRLRPGLDRDPIQQGGPIPMGPYSPDSATGTYCTSSDHQPYCPRKPGDRGHPKCCIGGVANLDENRVVAKPEKEPSDAPGVMDDPPDHTSTTTTTTAAPSSSAEMVVNLTHSLHAAERALPTESMEAEPSPTVAMNRVGDDDGVVLVLPSTEIDLPSSTTASPIDEEPVFPVYSTVADTANGPVLVVMATPVRNTSSSQENTIDGSPGTKSTKAPRPFTPLFSQSPHSVNQFQKPSHPYPMSRHPFSPSLNSFSSSPNSFSPSSNPFPTSSNSFSPGPGSFPMSPNSFSPVSNSFPTSSNAFPPSSNSFQNSPNSFPVTHPMFDVEPSMTEMMPPKPTQSLPPQNTQPVSFPSDMPPRGMNMPGGGLPGGPMRGEPMPGGPMPGGPMRGEPMPGGPMPGGPMPGGPMPEGPMPEGPMPEEPSGVAAVPMSPPPPHGGIPIPGAPDDGDAPIPMAGSLTGPWVPMVMLPPTPFSTDSWKVRTSSKMPPVRRSTFRNYVYE